jgi:murein DD-endopeptidase MepM/ murein hydrolase activator NlpD
VIRRAVVVALVLVAAVLGLLLCGIAAAVSALVPGGNPSVISAGMVKAGRPCANPIETQGYMPGPGAFEPKHTGIDFVCIGNMTIVAVLPGIVVIAVDGPCPNTLASGVRTFGCNVTVKTIVDGRTLYLRYAHLEAGSLAVTAGQEVVTGAALGTEGASGFATGPHLHFEVDSGAASTADCIDPKPFLDRAIVQ